SAEGAGEAALREVTQIPCPICDDGPASPRYRGTCSAVCEEVRDEESAPPRRRVLCVGQMRGGVDRCAGSFPFCAAIRAPGRYPNPRAASSSRRGEQSTKSLVM